MACRHVSDTAPQPSRVIEPHAGVADMPARHCQLLQLCLCGRHDAGCQYAGAISLWQARSCSPCLPEASRTDDGSKRANRTQPKCSLTRAIATRPPRAALIAAIVHTVQGIGNGQPRTECHADDTTYCNIIMSWTVNVVWMYAGTTDHCPCVGQQLYRCSRVWQCEVSNHQLDTKQR